MDSDYSDDYGEERFTSESPYYGFWIDYTVNESSTAPAVVRYGEEGYKREQWGTIKSSQATPLTWLPLAGVYSGNMESFSDVGGFSSLHVNGIVWLNAPSAANTNRPPGVFLHGTEGQYDPDFNGHPYYKYDIMGGPYVVDEAKESSEGDYIRKQSWGNNYYYEYVGNENIKDDQTAYVVTFVKADWWGNYNYISGDSGENGNGRHLHELDETDNNLLALPQYAGSVRCIRDKDAVISTNNVISASNITLSSANSYSYEVTITAVESWRVTNPGAKWVVISPDNGNIGTTTITISSEALTSGSSPEEATITIQFARGSTKEIKVTRQY